MIVEDAISWWFLIPGGGLIALFIYGEMRINRRHNRLLRTVAWSIALIALALLYMRPSVSAVAPHVKIILETDHADPRTVDSLLTAGYLKANRPNQLTSSEYVVDVLAIVGTGPDASVFANLPYPITFYPGEIPEGISDITSTPAVAENVFTIHGNIIARDSFTLSLKTPEGLILGRRLTPNQARFEFQTTPKSEGRFLYTLLGVRGSDTLFTEKYPVIVAPAGEIRILILSSIPTFELRYLKNYFVDLGYGVATRFEIAPGQFTNAYYNMEQVNLDRMDSERLEQFEIIVISPEVFGGFSTKTRQLILDQVAMNKTGLLLTGSMDEYDLLRPVHPSVKSILLKGSQGNIGLSMHKSIPKTFDPVQIQDQVIGGTIDYGSGRIGFSFLDRTYSLVLKGERELYEHLWQTTSRAIVGRKSEDTYSSIGNLNFRDSRLSFKFLSLEQLRLFIDSVQIPLEESFARPGLFTGDFWPQRVGWHEGRTLPDSTFRSFYVARSDSWPALRARQQSEWTTNFIATRSEQPPKNKSIYRPISKWYFFLLFLVCMGYLWLEQKLNG